MKAALRTLRHLVLICSLLGCLAACGGERSTPEEEVRAWLAAVHVAAEEKDRPAIVDRISAAYVDSRGNSRNDVDNTLRGLFLRQNRISILPSVESITIHDGTAAEVVVTVGMAGTNNSMLGLSADAYRFELELEKDGGDWLLIAARWGELGEQIR